MSLSNGDALILVIAQTKWPALIVRLAEQMHNSLGMIGRIFWCENCSFFFSSLLNVEKRTYMYAVIVEVW